MIYMEVAKIGQAAYIGGIEETSPTPPMPLGLH